MSDPFTEPMPKGTAPYHLRDRDEVAETKHRRLLKEQEALRPAAPTEAPHAD